MNKQKSPKKATSESPAIPDSSEDLAAAVQLKKPKRKRQKIVVVIDQYTRYPLGVYKESNLPECLARKLHHKEELRNRSIRSRSPEITRSAKQVVGLGSVFIGDSFVFLTAAILGAYAGKLPPYEGQVLTVVGFNPHNKNNVIVRDPSGQDSLMLLEMVEKGLKTNPRGRGRLQ